MVQDCTPKGRQDGLLVEEVDGETLVYDLTTDEAHCLNATAALVWRASDGTTHPVDIARHLEEEGLPSDEMVVWLALARLERAGLLEGPVPFPAGRRSFTRKEVLKHLGRTTGLALMLPAVTSITAPLAAQAASCIPLTQCRSARPPSCTGLPICENRNRCCVQQGGGRRARCRPRKC